MLPERLRTLRFDFMPGVIVSVIVAVVVILIGESFPEGEVADH